MGRSKIEWTERTWNPVRGCSRVSEGCRNCYAERIAARFNGEHGEPSKPRDTAAPFFGFATATNSGSHRWTGRVELIESKLEEPLHWRKPRTVFVNSMSDLFHEALPYEAIDRVFAVMALCPQHIFQVLTKRPERMREYSQRIDDGWTIGLSSAIYNHRPMPGQDWTWPLPNVSLGVSVEDQATADGRIPLLLQTPAATRFISYEPALGPVDFSPYLPLKLCNHYPGQTSCDSCRAQVRSTLNWVIAGGESGPRARPAHPGWFRSVRDQCQAAGVPFFMKQITERGRKIPFDTWPKDLKVREMPNANS